uniref:Uncharacterized protein n=1 Tax=Ixodes scapularis TaxID=6945 RepID=A0A4D5S571_IXOSC
MLSLHCRFFFLCCFNIFALARCVLLFFFLSPFSQNCSPPEQKENPQCEERLESCVIVCLPIGWCGVAEFVLSSQPPHELLHFVVLTLFALFGNVCMHCMYIWPLAQVSNLQ